MQELRPKLLAKVILDPTDLRAEDPPRYGYIGTIAAVGMKVKDLGYILFKTRTSAEDSTKDDTCLATVTDFEATHD